MRLITCCSGCKAFAWACFFTDGTQASPSTEVSVRLSHLFPRAIVAPPAIHHALRVNSQAGALEVLC